MGTVSGFQFKKQAMALLWATFNWHGVSAAAAMDVKQMRAMVGAQMLGSRVAQVIEAYGHASAILPRDTNDQDNKVLPAGDWAVVYTPTKPPSDPGRQQQAGQWLRLQDLSRLVLYAKGGVGQVIVRRKPLKTTYEISDDPYQAHQVISLRAELRHPITVARLIDQFGTKYDEIETAGKERWLRYWVMQRQGEMPHKLYAVDFGLNNRGDKAMVLVANGPQVDFVAQVLVSQYKLWEKNLYD